MRLRRKAVQRFRRIEELQGERGDVRRVGQIVVAPFAQRPDRPPRTSRRWCSAPPCRRAIVSSSTPSRSAASLKTKALIPKMSATPSNTSAPRDDDVGPRRVEPRGSPAIVGRALLRQARSDRLQLGNGELETVEGVQRGVVTAKRGSSGQRSRRCPTRRRRFRNRVRAPRVRTWPGSSERMNGTG